MVADIFLVLFSVMLGFIHTVLLIPDALFSIASFNLILLPMIAWLFTPLRFFGTWIDLQTLGVTINSAFLIISVWFTIRLIFLAVGFIPGVGRANSTLNPPDR